MRSHFYFERIGVWLSRAKGKYEYWLTEDGLILLSAWARDGATDEDIAKNIGIAPATLYEWKKRFPEISEALKKNKELADIVIENELYESCKGRTVTIKKPIKVKKVRVTEKGERFETEVIEYADEEVHIPLIPRRRYSGLKTEDRIGGETSQRKKKTDSVQELLKGIQTMADIIRKPVPDRNIEDFEK